MRVRWFYGRTAEKLHLSENALTAQIKERNNFSLDKAMFCSGNRIQGTYGLKEIGLAFFSGLSPCKKGKGIWTHKRSGYNFSNGSRNAAAKWGIARKYASRFLFCLSLFLFATIKCTTNLLFNSSLTHAAQENKLHNNANQRIPLYPHWIPETSSLDHM